MQLSLSENPPLWQIILICENPEKISILSQYYYDLSLFFIYERNSLHQEALIMC